MGEPTYSEKTTASESSLTQHESHMHRRESSPDNLDGSQEL
jgi:hypothetical protein